MMESKNLGAVFDAHIKAEFVDRDVAETMATMTPEPHLTHVPTLTGGTGRSEVERFYREHFVGHWPDDVQVKSVSRTVGQNQVVDELIVSFTHDREMRVYLPGVVPTGRKVVLPHNGFTTSLTSRTVDGLPRSRLAIIAGVVSSEESRCRGGKKLRGKKKS